MADEQTLRLIARDEADLTVISAMAQDAILKTRNIRYDRRQRRFTVEINRFRWETLAKRGPHLRTHALIVFDSVLGVRAHAVSKAAPDMVLSVLSIQFTPDNQPPGGMIRILFAGDRKLMIQVEAVDVTLFDGQHEWPTRHTPNHDRHKG